MDNSGTGTIGNPSSEQDLGTAVPWYCVACGARLAYGGLFRTDPPRGPYCCECWLRSFDGEAEEDSDS